jgi:hypothetical protein
MTSTLSVWAAAAAGGAALEPPLRKLKNDMVWLESVKG